MRFIKFGDISRCRKWVFIFLCLVIVTGFSPMVLFGGEVCMPSLKAAVDNLQFCETAKTITPWEEQVTAS